MCSARETRLDVSTDELQYVRFLFIRGTDYFSVRLETVIISSFISSSALFSVSALRLVFSWFTSLEVLERIVGRVVEVSQTLQSLLEPDIAG